MKKKNTLPIVAMAIAFFTGACIDDTGNYDYSPVENVFPVEISGLQDTSFLLTANVELQPIIKGLDSDLEKYAFTWYTYPIMAVGYAPARDTLGTGTTLSFVMNYPPGERRMLVFEIKEKSTGLIANKKVEITSASVFSRGWFVVNDLDGQTDIDFIDLDGLVREDVISRVNGQKLQGKGVRMVLQSGFYYHDKRMPDGTIMRLSNQTVFHVLSEQDMKTLNAASFEIYKNFEDEFYSPPAVWKPQDIMNTYLGYVFLINDGKLYSITGMTAGPGKFAHPKIGDANLYPCVLAGDFAQQANVFSRASSSFLVDNMSTDLVKVESDDGTPPTNMDHEMLWMARRFQRYSSSAQAWAIMRSKSAPVAYHLVDIDASGSMNPIVGFHPLNASARLLSADVYGIHPEHSAAIYFAKGNLLSYFQKGDASGDDEVDLWTFPADETIAYVGKNSSTTHLEVLTNSNNTWKLYIFPLANSGQYAYIQDGASPLAVYSGNGNARFVLYR
ncbi:MAG: hypothetical protein LBP56_05470 [Odoribacteraceae bacterium]|jgi:hypothetical protein|nr:hypothetical protein [Odoribacteraceae bacterium]